MAVVEKEEAIEKFIARFGCGRNVAENYIEAFGDF